METAIALALVLIVGLIAVAAAFAKGDSPETDGIDRT